MNPLNERKSFDFDSHRNRSASTTIETAGQRTGRKGTAFPQDLTVAIITHNMMSLLPSAVDALRLAKCPDNRIMIIDVASTDNTDSWVRSRVPESSFTRLESNQGANPARNLAILQCPTPYLLLMDSDARVSEGMISELHRVIDSDPSIGIASPLVVYADRPDIIQYGGTWLHCLCEAVIEWQGKSVEERGMEMSDIGCASGNGLMVRRDAAIEIGLFDERYLIAKDDGDFTYRMRIAGHRIVEVPTARVLHATKERGTRWLSQQITDRWHFMLKNFQLRTLLFALPILLLHEVFLLSMLLLKGHGKAYVNAIIALIPMCRGLAEDRRRVRSYRRVNDMEVLRADPFAVQEGFMRNRPIRILKSAYDRLIGTYWAIMKRIAG